MVATVSVYLDTTGSDNSPGTSTDIDALGPPALRFKTADNATIDTVNPVPIPAAGTNYSFIKSIYVKCDVAPDTQIDNFRLYSDGGGFGTGITTSVGNQFPVKNSGSSSGYAVATGTIGTTGTEMTVNNTDVTTKTDLFTFTSGSPMTGPSISEAGSIINLAGETTNYVILQVAVGTTATPGNKTDETLTFLYDEI